MSKYNLNNFGAQRFELLSQNLVQHIIGPGSKVYGMGKDGAREATFKGKAQYPSKEEIWDGSWIFQAKFHDIQQIGQKEARNLLFRELDEELRIITEKYNHPCDNYILITNVSLSPVYKTGLKDKIDEIIVPKYKKHIKNIHIWGAEEVCSLLDISPNIRQRYSDLLVSGDIISKLIGLVEEENNHLDEIVKLYCQGSFVYESAAALDDAGDIDDQKIDLPKVFIDLNVELSKIGDFNSIPDWMKKLYKEGEKETALSYILDDSVKRMVFIGGPGLGKSTLGQYVSQVYRARLIGKLKEFEPDKSFLESIIPRIPFRIILKDFAWWLSKQKVDKNESLFHYLSYDLSSISNLTVSADDIHKIIKNNPIMLILDGLDEVPEKELRQRVLEQINIFINQISNVYNSDFRIIASTRPQGYTDEFDPTHYLQVNLKDLNEDLALDYATRWINEKEKNPKEVAKILGILKMCLTDKIVKDLTKTPLQITILLVIIRAGSTPPKQREELYQTYMDTIYRREQKKNINLISTDRNIIYGLHQYLGYLLHKRAEKDRTDALMTIEEFREHVLDYILYLDPMIDEEQLSIQAQRIIMEARNRFLLIDSPQEDKVGFTLTVMREFFAACHLVESSKDSGERNERFKSIAKTPYWRNVALFFAGRVGRTLIGEASSLIDICREVDIEDENQYLKRGSQLALEIVKDKALRVPYNELSALEYSLNTFEADLLYDSYELISVLKENSINESFSKLIKRWLIEKINSVKQDRVKKYLEVYYEVFGLNSFILGEIKRLSLINNLKVTSWEFKLILNNKIYEDWVVNVIERLVQKDNYYFMVDMENCNWENLIPLFSLNLNDDTKIKLSKLLYDLILNFDLEDQEEYSLFNRIMKNIINEQNELRDERYLLPWGVCFTLKSSNIKYSTENKVKFPAIAYPTLKENINHEKQLLSQFVSSYKDRNDQFIKLLTNLFSFYLNPETPKSYLELHQDSEDRRLLFSIFGNLSREQYSDVLTLFNLYNTEVDIENDLEELKCILSDTNEDFYKYGYWIDSNLDSSIEKFLDPAMVRKVQDWFHMKKVPFNAVETTTRMIEKIDIKQMALIQLEFLKDKIHNSEKSNINIIFISIYLEQNKEFDTEKEYLVNELLEVMQYLINNQIGEKITFEIFYILISLGEITDQHIKLMNAKLDLISYSRVTNFFHYYYDSNTITSNLIGFINSRDEEVSLTSAILFSILSRNLRYNSMFNLELDSLVSTRYWNILLENKGDIKEILIKGLEFIQLDWKEVGIHFSNDIFSSDNDVQKPWINIIRFGGYIDDKSKVELLELLFYILDNEKEQINLYRAAMLRLDKETINSEFNDEILNLPLPKRKNNSFFW